MESVSLFNLHVHGTRSARTAHPLLRATLYAYSRRSRTVTTYLIAVRQGAAFLREHGVSLEAAPGPTLRLMGDLLARRMAGTAATHHTVLTILYGSLAEKVKIPANLNGQIMR